MITLAATTQYLEWKKGYYPSAYRSYKPFIKKINSYFINRELKSYKDIEIAQFISILKLKYKPKSVYYFVSILKDFFKYYPNIINPHHIKCPRLESEDIHFLSEEEFIVIDESLNVWNQFEVRAKLIHNILWSTGMRVGELCSIHLDSIDMVKHSAKIITEKSRRTGYIMWGEVTHVLLIRYLGTRLQRGGDYLFDISSRQVQRIIKDVSENVGITGITPHKYRHGKAHKMYKDGATIDDIAFVLRHTNPALTKQMYLRLDKNENMSIMSKYV